MPVATNALRYRTHTQQQGRAECGTRTNAAVLLFAAVQAASWPAIISEPAKYVDRKYRATIASAPRPGWFGPERYVR